ncbi:MAG: transposase [Roseburia intestinalis]|nr:MAG: transposase [Roseburia intestinalis]
MGTADMVTKEYMRENAVFADAFNYLIYNGKKVIDPAKLKEIDPTEIALPFGDEEKAGEDKKGKVQETEWSSVKNGSVRKKTAGRAGKKTDAVQKYRDILKSAVIKQDEKMSYVLLGIENQTDVHYAMPVRNAIYDALQYGRQVADIAAEHRRNKKDFTGKSNGEYLSGFLKEDCIKPVITLVIHFGAEEWDGPLSLHEMMSVSDIEILSFVENYRIHLIDPAEQLNKFSTSMREVIGYIKYSKNKDKLLEFLRTDAHRSIEMNAARVIKTITNTPIEVSEEEGEIEMCKAIEDLIAESEARGRAEGEVRGEARGRAEGETRGEAKGMIEICLDMSFSKEDILKKLQEKLNISLQQAGEYFEMYGKRTV